MLSIRFSDLLHLSEWALVSIATDGDLEHAVHDVELVLHMQQEYRKDVLYCFPWHSSLYDPSLDIVIRRMARDCASGIMIVREVQQSTPIDIPSHLIELGHRLRVNILFCSTTHFPTIWSAMKQRLASLDYIRLRKMEEAIRSLKTLAASCTSVEEFTASVSQILQLPVKWNAHPSQTQPCYPVNVAKETVGYLVGVSRGDESYRDLLAVIGGLAAAIHLADLSRLQVKSNFHSDLLQLILNQRIDAQTLAVTARRAKLNPEAQTRIAVLTTRFGALHAEEFRFWENLFLELEQSLNKKNMNALTGYVSGHPTLLIQPQTGRESADLKFAVHEEINRCFQGVLSNHIIVGLSSVQILRSGCADLFKEAVEAVTIGRALGKNETVIEYEGLGKDRLFYSLLTSPFVVLLARNLLQPLLDSDVEHGTEYLQTVSAYVMNDRKLAETARMLNLHRNSLRYRLSNIEQLLGFGMDDTERVLLLQLAVLSHRLHRPDTDSTLDSPLP